MNCIGPVKPDEAELMAYADSLNTDPLGQADEAGVSLKDHASRCAACQARVQRLAGEQRVLAAVLGRASCPPSLVLGEYHLRLLGEQRAAVVNEHLTLCRACRNEVAELAAFLAGLRRPVVEATQDLFGSLRTITAQRPASSPGGKAGAFAPALRSARDSEERAPFVYSAEDVLVSVDAWAPRTGQPGRIVAGLVVGPVDFTDADATMGAAVTTTIDDRGNFLFSEVSPGLHHLMIRLPATGLQIEIEDLLVR